MKRSVTRQLSLALLAAPIVTRTTEDILHPNTERALDLRTDELEGLGRFRVQVEEVETAVGDEDVRLDTGQDEVRRYARSEGGHIQDFYLGLAGLTFIFMLLMSARRRRRAKR